MIVRASGLGIFALLLVRAVSVEASAQQDYILHCAGCHKLDGSGSTRVPGLDDIPRVLAHEGGRQYLGRVPGAAQAPLSDTRLAALLNWLVSQFAGAPPRPAYSASEVGRLRSMPLRDPARARACIVDGVGCGRAVE